MQAQPTRNDTVPGVRPRVFVSYRREDTRHVAGRLADHLNEGFDLFMDVEDIEPGTDYTEALQRAVRESQVLLALIGPGWVNARDKAGRRRIDDPADWVANEIWAGLSRQIVVIPVLVDDAQMPRPDELPPLLTELSTRQAVTLRHESFTDDCARLVRAIERALSLPPGPAGFGQPTPTRTRPGGRRLGVLLGGILAAVVVALVVLIAVVTGGGDDVIIAGTAPTNTVRPTPTKSPTRRATPSRSPSPPTRPTLQLTVGQTANFASFDVTVAGITADATFGVLVDANVCLVRDNDSDGKSRISWDPWTITDRDGVTYRPELSDASHPPANLFPEAQTVPVGTCVRGVIPYGGVPTTAQVASASYRNSLGDRARWSA